MHGQWGGYKSVPLDLPSQEHKGCLDKLRKPRKLSDFC